MRRRRKQVFLDHFLEKVKSEGKRGISAVSKREISQTFGAQVLPDDPFLRSVFIENPKQLFFYRLLARIEALVKDMRLENGLHLMLPSQEKLIQGFDLGILTLLLVKEVQVSHSGSYVPGVYREGPGQLKNQMGVEEMVYFPQGEAEIESIPLLIEGSSSLEGRIQQLIVVDVLQGKDIHFLTHILWVQG